MKADIQDIPNDPLVSVDMTFEGLLSAAVNTVPPNLMAHWLGKCHPGDCVELMNKMPANSVSSLKTSAVYTSKKNGLVESSI